MKNVIKSSDEAAYTATKKPSTIVERALKYLEAEFKEKRIHADLEAFTSPDIVKNYLTLKLAQEDREHFIALYLNTKHQLIEVETLFSGTIDGASVYPREVVKQALKHNAKALIFAHNHPSGIAEPSQADKSITSKLKECCAMFDMSVLDHIIVGGMETYSFSEHGLI